ncbi:MAG: TetR family transcriptional regulator C-terminal domain-containing protein [Rhodocyclaceae bacterium]|nr:TetR family transcriptional regulator C-terminal domain-containing protein [Rhodocyclaceae bacterium]MBX3669823.1 TetR family transcriptional regulator C-terminal domain-containing protein [Rhodocyclaceae bacterium]
MDTANFAQPPLRRRGRPTKGSSAPSQTRAAVVRAGVALLTEHGVTATGIDQVLNAAGIPKGSFYHYFGSKENFLKEVVLAYGDYFSRKLARHFENADAPPLARIEAFVADAAAGMARYEFRRGCLAGNLGQEVAALSDDLRRAIVATFEGWEAQLADCLHQAVARGDIAADADVAELASAFWTGWEGAVLRAKLQRDGNFLFRHARQFIAALPRNLAPPAA